MMCHSGSDAGHEIGRVGALSPRGINFREPIRPFPIANVVISDRSRNVFVVKLAQLTVERFRDHRPRDFITDRRLSVIWHVSLGIQRLQ